MDDCYIGMVERGETRWPREYHRAGLRGVLGAATDAEIGLWITNNPGGPSGTTDDGDGDGTKSAPVAGLPEPEPRPSGETGTRSGLSEVAVGLCPPVGAGVLGVQCREDDTTTIEAVTALGDPEAWRQTTAERMLLHVLQGHCNSPIAGYATSESDGRLSLRARVFSPDGKHLIDAHEWDTDPTTLGTAVALALLRQGARELIDAIPH